MIYPKRIKEINTYLVELIIDLYEQVSVYVDAYSESEADAIGITMFENGKLDCAGQIEIFFVLPLCVQNFDFVGLLQYDPSHSDSPHSNQIHSPIY